MKYIHFFSILCLLFAVNVAAQESVEQDAVDAQEAPREAPKSPRDTIIHHLGLDGSPQDSLAGQDVGGLVQESTVSQEAPKIESNKIIIEASEDAGAEAKQLASKAAMPILEVGPIPEVGPIQELEPAEQVELAEKIGPAVETSPVKNKMTIAPFYMSAAQYLELRGTLPAPQSVLDYEVHNAPNVIGAKDAISILKGKLGAAQKVTLMLGVDYASIETEDEFKIYDFKLNRVLIVKSEYGFDGKPTGRKLFDNTSLYAKAYRDMTAVRRATQNGRLKKLDMGQGVSLDAFWVESAMSWAAGPRVPEPRVPDTEAPDTKIPDMEMPDTEIKVEGADNALVITRKGETIFSAEFSDEAYDAALGKDSLFALAHLEWPLHPNVLRALYGYDAPPKTFEMLSYGPMAPKGQKQVWTLVKRTDEEAVFPLPKEALGVAQRGKTSPLVLMINEAVNNHALGGLIANEKLIEGFAAALEAGEIEHAWSIGQQYLAYTGGCTQSANESICSALADIEQNQQNDLSERTQAYIAALHFAGRPGLKVEAVNAVKAYLDESETPAFIIRTAAMTRARMKPAQARTAGLSSLSAEKLLKAALAKDPYDPNTYVGLAQVFAANGAFEQSWDINDALRAGIPTADYLDLKIDRLEKKLKKSAPGYFLGD